MLSQTMINTLAVIADTYTPLLLLLALIDVVRSWLRGNKLHFVQLLCAIVVVYGLMLLDNRFLLWPRIGLDYSTHSAAAFALVVIIGLRKNLIHKLWLAMSLVTYGCLMHLLNYHTWGVMLTTLLLVGAVLLPIFYVFKQGKPPALNGV